MEQSNESLRTTNLEEAGIPSLGVVNPNLYTLSDKEVEIVHLHGEKELHVFPAPREHQGGTDYVVTATSTELTSLCPVTGQPDFCTLAVEYVPDKWCVELKSFKFYLVSFRNEGHFYEELINQIYGDIQKAAQPKFLYVKGDFNSRGGIPETVEVGVHLP